MTRTVGYIKETGAGKDRYGFACRSENWSKSEEEIRTVMFRLKLRADQIAFTQHFASMQWTPDFDAFRSRRIVRGDDWENVKNVRDALIAVGYVDNPNE
jgi:hypothetical protein